MLFVASAFSSGNLACRWSFASASTNQNAKYVPMTNFDDKMALGNRQDGTLFNTK